MQQHIHDIRWQLRRAHLFFGAEDVQRQRVRLCEDDDWRVADGLHGPRHPACYLTAVGDQDLAACGAGAQLGLMAAGAVVVQVSGACRCGLRDMQSIH